LPALAADLVRHKVAVIVAGGGPSAVAAKAGSMTIPAWPLVARAQQGDRLRRIGVLMPFDENDPEGKRRLSAFTQALADLGWSDARNVRMDLRWWGDDINRLRALARELVGLQLLPQATVHKRISRTEPARPLYYPLYLEHTMAHIGGRIWGARRTTGCGA
jgi:hypothetical protein